MSMGICDLHSRLTSRVSTTNYDWFLGLGEPQSPQLILSWNRVPTTGCGVPVDHSPCERLWELWIRVPMIGCGDWNTESLRLVVESLRITVPMIGCGNWNTESLRLAVESLWITVPIIGCGDCGSQSPYDWLWRLEHSPYDWFGRLWSLCILQSLWLFVETQWITVLMIGWCVDTD